MDTVPRHYLIVKDDDRLGGTKVNQFPTESKGGVEPVKGVPVLRAFRVASKAGMVVEEAIS